MLIVVAAVVVENQLIDIHLRLIELELHLLTLTLLQLMSESDSEIVQHEMLQPEMVQPVMVAFADDAATLVHTSVFLHVVHCYVLEFDPNPHS
jgi:hypothetical protein